MQEAPWQVVHVVANHEKRVAGHLGVRSVEHYLPLYAEQSRWSDRTVRVERPLFGGYVFVRFSPRARLAVVSIPGVLRILGEHGHNAVGADEIMRIREGLRSGCLLRPHPWVELGMRVRVRSGVFAGVEGIVTELRKDCRVVLALAAVRQCFSLEMNLRDLEVLPIRPLSNRTERISLTQ